MSEFKPDLYILYIHIVLNAIIVILRNNLTKEWSLGVKHQNT